MNLRSTPASKARIGFICTMEALAKGCHNLWVTRHASNKKIGFKRIRNLSGEMEKECKSESEASWTENLFREAPSHLLSMDDEHTPLQEEDDESHDEGDQNADAVSAVRDEVLPNELGDGEHIRVRRKRINVDYKTKKSKKRHTHVSIGYQEAILTGNPQSPMV